MFIKKLTISSPTGIIRDINFSSGLNIIIDDTPTNDLKSTGNNVGKTTVLKLIDFCLGAKANIIYTDTENKKETYDVVKNFLINNEILITLILSENLNNSQAKELKIERNFLNNKRAIRKINGIPILEKDFENELEKCIMPKKEVEKPTFRQLISHNIRYKDNSITNTLKTLDKYTTDIEYETLNLFLIGCTFNKGAEKQALINQINQEENFRKHLEKDQSKTTYEITLAMVEDEIKALNDKKSLFNLNERFEEDLGLLDITKNNINRISSKISKLQIRKNLIEESANELKQSVSNIDMKQLKILYNEAKENISGIQKTFEDLVEYHNNMVLEKAKYISKDLPIISQNLKDYHLKLDSLLKEEKRLTDIISKGDSFKQLEKVISELNEKYRIKGEYERIISQLNEVEKNINDINIKLSSIDNYIFSDEYEKLLKEQVKKFNKVFSSISEELYNEKYALTYTKKLYKKELPYYYFSSFNANLSSGKKQGEILCFDLAYLLFARRENIPAVNFLLNDKKELMSDNQLVLVSDFVKRNNIQLIISILKDKLPTDVLNNAYIAVELSQDDKLFKIEN